MDIFAIKFRRRVRNDIIFNFLLKIRVDLRFHEMYILQSSEIAFKLIIMERQLKWDDLVALDENKYQYEPEEQQIQEYAHFLGLTFPDDNRFLYLVVEGLKAPLPPFWEACESSDGEIYFRNKKSRKITAENPLDEAYRQKIDNLKLLQTRNNFFPINEQSAINESSGMFKSKLKNSDLKTSINEYNNKQEPNKILNRQITEESVYSQRSEEIQLSSPKKSSILKSNTYGHKLKEEKTKHILKLLEIKNNIMRIVPKDNQMITKIQDPLSSFNMEDLSKIMDIAKLQTLSRLRCSVQQKKRRLQRLNEVKRSLKAKMSQIRQSKDVQ